MILFPRQATSAFTVIDWQCLNIGPPGFDFVQLCTHSLEPASEFSRLDELLQAHYTRLTTLRPEVAAVYSFATVSKYHQDSAMHRPSSPSLM